MIRNEFTRFSSIFWRQNANLCKRNLNDFCFSFQNKSVKYACENLYFFIFRIDLEKNRIFIA